MIIFNASKEETHHPKGSFSLLAQKLRDCGKIKINRKELSADLLEDCDVIIFGNSQTAFSGKELRVLRDYVDGGGSIAIFASEGGESRSKSNINELLKDYGIRIDNSTVVRSVYHRYFHPKHALIANGIVQPEIGPEKGMPLALDSSKACESSSKRPQDDAVDPSSSLSFVYPNGTTLDVQSPSFTLLSSGSTSYPVDCPIAAAWEGDIVSCRPSGKRRQGRLVVLGSANVFADYWIEKEENCSLCNVLFRFVLHQKISFDPSLGRADFEEKEVVPDISSLANLVKTCVQEDEPLPQDYKSLLIEHLFSMKMDNITDVMDVYKRLNVPYEPLTLIEPHFESPQPSLRMATHEPKMIAPPPPALELFDLDESFLDVRIRLHKLRSKFHEDEDLNVFVEEAGLLVVPDMYQYEEWSLHGVQLSKYLLYRVGVKVRDQIVEFI
jgi:intraflagellar transport protein 52